jgi:hypothetical protein
VGLICFFQISLFNNAATPSTSPFPCPRAKQILNYWTSIRITIGCGEIRYHDTKYHARMFLNWPKQPSVHTMCCLGMQLTLCRYC